MGKSTTSSRAFRLTNYWSAILALSAMSVAAIQLRSSAGQAPKTQGERITVRYTDIRQTAGITFRQDSTQTEEKYYFETMGTGVGWIDYDQDGFMDLYFVQSAATDIYKPPHPLRSALYHNNGDGTFTDVTEKAGVGGEGHYGQGVAVGCYDNDGDIDIAINNRGDYPELLRNDGGNANHWLEVLLIGTKSNRHGIGSSLKLTSEKGRAHRKVQGRHEIYGV